MPKQVSDRVTCSPSGYIQPSAVDNATQSAGGDVIIYGPGRVGSSLLLSFAHAGMNPHEHSDLTATWRGPGPAVWFICVPDSAMESVVRELFASPSRFRPDTDHCVIVSATTDITDLRNACGDATNICRAHPLYPFPPAGNSTVLPAGTPFATENAHEVVLGAVRRIGGIPFNLDPDKRYLYHAAAVMVSNLPGALWYASSMILAGCGVPSAEGHAAKMLQRLATSLADGGLAALPGPAARGDKETVLRDQAAIDRYDEDLAAVHRILSEIIATDMFGNDRQLVRK